MQAATDRELNEFWGVETSASQWAEATERQTRAYDEDDAVEDVYENSTVILAALAAGDALTVGKVLLAARAKMIARRVSIELTGEVEKSPLSPAFGDVAGQLAKLTIRGQA